MHPPEAVDFSDGSIALAWRIVKGSAEMLLRCEQPARGAYVVTVTGRDVDIREECLSESKARALLRQKMRAFFARDPVGTITHCGHVRHFRLSWNRKVFEL